MCPKPFGISWPASLKWLKVRDPSRVEPIAGIDFGEQAAISLVQEIGADLLLIGELDAPE
jgi:hypothetical protein